MSLAETLNATRAVSEKRIPADRRATMHRATEDLRRSGILDRIVGVVGVVPPMRRYAADGSFTLEEFRQHPTPAEPYRLTIASPQSGNQT